MNRFPAICLLLLLTAAPGAGAQGFIIPRPIRPIPGPQPLSVRSQKITMQVSSGALKVDVEQVFYNPNSVPMEGTYLFPLPAGAAVSGFRMLIDREPVEGKILSVDEARRVYESYVRRNVDPAILEYVGRNAFQARVFPIPAGGERRIYLSYGQVPEFSAGLYRIVYPLNSERVTGQGAGELTIECAIRSPQPIKSVYSPSHEVQIKRESENLARASYESKNAPADRDFVLYYSTSEKAFGLNALAHRRAAEPGYVMLMLAPRHQVSRAEVQPKDVVFLFDTSGSMQGAKIDQARKALQTVLGALNEQDRFNIIRFSSDTASFRPGVVPATASNRSAARAFVDEFRAVGGTGIDDALQAALASLPKPEDRQGRAPFLIFMTDGLPTVGTTDVDQILRNSVKAAPTDLRLFSFGVGADVNTLLLDRLARDNRGAADYIDANEDLEARIGTFYAKIADPVLANVQVAMDGARLSDIYPTRLPDLFAGTQLLVLGRYQGQGKATVTLTGDLNGKPQRFTYDLTLPERDLENGFVPKLWAGRRIGFLLEEIRLKGENAELKDEVIRLSKEHGIVTPYTSYLVEEPGARDGLNLGFRPLSVDESLQRGSRTAPLQERLGQTGGAGGLGGGGVGGGGFGGGQVGRARTKAPANAPGGKPDSRVLGRESKPTASGPEAAAAMPQLRADAGKKVETEKELRLNIEAQRYRQQAEGFNRSTGWNAVEASRRVRELKDKRLGDSEVEVSRSVGGRVFRNRAGAWFEESAEQGKPRIIAIRYGSEAYFRLVTARAEWARYLSVGRQVTFRTGKSTVVTVGEKGLEKLSDAELKDLEK